MAEKNEGGYGTTNPKEIKNKKGKTLPEYPKIVKIGIGPNARKIRVFNAEQEAKELGKSLSLTSPKQEVKTNDPNPNPSPPNPGDQPKQTQNPNQQNINPQGWGQNNGWDQNPNK